MSDFWKMLGAMSVVLGVGLVAEPVQAQEDVCTPRNERTARGTVDPLLEEGVVRMHLRGVYVNPIVWAMADAQVKEELTHRLAVYRNCIWYPRQH